jgi:hypothetical protein
MPKPAAEHHLLAAEHLEKSAAHHREAAKYHEEGDAVLAGFHGHCASGHFLFAEHHANKANKEHADTHAPILKEDTKSDKKR